MLPANDRVFSLLQSALGDVCLALRYSQEDRPGTGAVTRYDEIANILARECALLRAIDIGEGRAPRHD